MSAQLEAQKSWNITKDKAMGAQLGDGSRGRVPTCSSRPVTCPVSAHTWLPCTQTPPAPALGHPREGHSPCVLWSHHIPRRQEPDCQKLHIYPHLVNHYLQTSRHPGRYLSWLLGPPLPLSPICPHGRQATAA